MVFGSYMPHLTKRILSVRTEQRAECAKLIPTRIQLTPFLIVRILFSGLVELLLSVFIAFFYAKSTNIHCPVRNTAYCKVQSGRNLCLHIFPTGSNISTPRRGRVALQSGKSRTGQQEYTLIIVCGTLSVINSLSIHQRIRIEILVGRTESSRTAQGFSISQIRTVAHIRFTGIHPPGIDSEWVKVIFHLFPEQLPCTFSISIIERAYVSGANPVADTVFNGLLIHPPLFIKLFIMFRSPIELRPNGNHHLSIHGMNGIYHPFRIRETSFVKLMATPGIFRPVAPVEHNIINRNLTFAEFPQNIQYFFLRLITFTALPVSHRPLRHDLRFPGQGAVSTDNLVHILTINKIIIDLILHFSPPRLFVLFFNRYRRQCTQTTIGYISVRSPFNFQWNAFTSLQIYGKLITIRVPSRTPTFGNHQFTVNIYLHVSCIIKDETEFSTLHRLYFSFVSHL